MGDSNTAVGFTLAEQIATEFTATRTSFLLEAGAVNVNLSILNPIEVKHSFYVNHVILLSTL